MWREVHDYEWLERIFSCPRSRQASPSASDLFNIHPSAEGLGLGVSSLWRSPIRVPAWAGLGLYFLSLWQASNCKFKVTSILQTCSGKSWPRHSLTLRVPTFTWFEVSGNYLTHEAQHLSLQFNQYSSFLNPSLKNKIPKKFYIAIIC